MKSIVSLHRQSDKKSSERHQRIVQKGINNKIKRKEKNYGKDTSNNEG